MNDDGGPDRPDDDNPYARPARDLPAEIQPDAGLGRVAGWIFLILGAIGVVQMAYRLSQGGFRIDIGAIAMLLIGRGLLARSNTARRWGIGCAGTYLGMLLIGGGIVLWFWHAKPVEIDLGWLSSGAAALAFVLGGIGIFSLLLWMLTHPRTRAAYRTGTTRVARRRHPRNDPPTP